MTDNVRYQPTIPKTASTNEEQSKAEADELWNQRVTEKYGYVLKITPSGTEIGAGVPCDAILLDTSSATVSFEPGEGGATVTLPLEPAVFHKVSASVISAVSSGNVWAAWHRRPPGA